MDQEYSEALGLEAEKETPEKEQTETAETAAPQEAEAPETERKPVMSQEERARQAAGRRLREREAAAVRLILAGKTAGFAPERIRERLRDLYG